MAFYRTGIITLCVIFQHLNCEAQSSLLSQFWLILSHLQPILADFRISRRLADFSRFLAEEMTEFFDERSFTKLTFCGFDRGLKLGCLVPFSKLSVLGNRDSGLLRHFFGKFWWVRWGSEFGGEVATFQIQGSFSHA